jgi:hypothetical protein
VILVADTFDRVGGTLGAPWSELGATNMSTDGAKAVIDSVAFHIATAAGTERSDHNVQCWVQSPNGSNNVGICWRVLDINNFYMVIIIPGTGIRLFRRLLGVFTQIGFLATGITSAVWHRLSVVHVGNRITVYFNQNYNTTAGLEGPVLDVTDAATPVSGVGPSGILTTGNNATGAAGPLWNDFCARNGDADTIYVDQDFNGGAVGEGWGSAARPDLGIAWALNNCGTVRGSKVKLTDAIYGDAAFAIDYSIGHAGRFGAAGYTFPQYDVDCGGTYDPGDPNLIIEGMDGGRTELNESSGGAGKAFFKLRDDATGIVFRGLDFVLPSTASKAVQLGIITTVDHSVQLAKCIFDITGATTTQATFYDAVGTLAVNTVLCYFKRSTAGVSAFFDSLSQRVRAYLADYCVFQGNGSTGTLDAAINSATTVDPQVPDAWRIAHCTVVDIYKAAVNPCGFAVLDPAGFHAVVDYRDNIHRGKTALLPMRWGVYTAGAGLGAGGSIGCHHNGYFNVTTPRDVGATDNDDEILTDPAFVGGASWAWLQTAGSGVNGEGTFAAMMLDTDYTPGNGDYLDSASDTSPVAGVLNRGAIQDWVECGPDGHGLQPTPGPVSPSVPIRFIRGLCPPDYCIEVLFDAFNATGAGPVFLTSELMDMRPLRDSKDYLLRDYRAQDVDLEFSDRDGRLDPRRTTSFLAGVNYFKARVEVRLIDNLLNVIATLYVGELLTVATSLGRTTWRLGNPFKRLLDKPLLANTYTRRVTTNGQTVASGGGSANYLAAVTVNPGCRCETWTFTFLNASQFTVSGSLTGDDGSGSTGATFTSESGSITVQPTDWQGVFAANNRVSIQTAYRTTGTVISALLSVLEDPEGGNLATWEIDTDAFDAQIGSPVNQAIDLIVDREQTVLKTLSDTARHMSATVFPLPDGRISLVTFVPRLQDRSTLEAFCHWDDLIDVQTEEVPVYNQFTFQWDYDGLDTQQFRQQLVWPKTDADNPSLQDFGVRQEAPATVELRGFDAGQDTVVEQLAQQFYNRWSYPQELYTCQLKAKRYALTLADLVYVQSLLPLREEFVELVELRKRFTGGAPQIEVDAVSVDRFIQSPTECGFVFYVPQHRADDCWVWF